MALNILEATNSALTSVFTSAKNALNTFQLSALINDINNYSQWTEIGTNGWISSDMPLFSNLYVFQPGLRNGNYIPRQQVYSVQLPDRTITTDSIKFQGIQINYPSGATTGNFVATFYETQTLNVTGFYEAWKSYAVSPNGNFYGLPNATKQDMLIILNNSLSVNPGTITNNLINSLPSNIQQIVNDVNFSGVVLLMGCFPTAVSYPEMKNPDNGVIDAVKVQVTFSVDCCLKMPLSLNVDQILEILGVSRSGVAGIKYPRPRGSGRNG